MANFLTKGKDTQTRKNFYTGEDTVASDTDGTNPRGRIAPAQDYVPVDMGRPSGEGQSVDQPRAQQPQAPTFSNDPTQMDQLGDILNSPLAQLPSFKRALELRNQRIALETMPTYVNSKGEQVQGLQDKDGRLQSGLKALVLGAAQNFGPGTRPARDWNDLLSRASGTISMGVTGSIVPEWNEWNDRQKEIERLKRDEADAMKAGQFESQMLTGAVNRQDKLADNTRQQKSLDDRIARHKILNLKDNQKMLLDPIFKRGYYYEGDNPQEDQALADAHVILPDYDSTHKPITNNGVREVWNPDTRKYEQAQGTEVDPDEVPMTFSVDGEKITASAKYFLNYKAGMEKQKNQQTFQAGENDKNREVQWARIKQAAEQFKAKTANDVVARKTAIAKALSDGDISGTEADELLTILRTNNPDFFK